MSFYAYNIICAVFAVFIYISFRFGVDSYLRVNKNSKTFIKKNKKGYLNYWFYKKIHAEVGLGRLYTLNILIFILTIVYFFVAICLGWVKALSMPIAICNAILCVVQIPAIIFSDIYQNLECKKSAFIVFRIDKETKKIESSFLIVFGICLLLFFAIFNILLAL